MVLGKWASFVGKFKTATWNSLSSETSTTSLVPNVIWRFRKKALRYAPEKAWYLRYGYFLLHAIQCDYDLSRHVYGILTTCRAIILSHAMIPCSLNSHSQHPCGWRVALLRKIQEVPISGVKLAFWSDDFAIEHINKRNIRKNFDCRFRYGAETHASA